MFMFRQIFARLKEVGDRLEDIERNFEAHAESHKIDFHSLEKRLIELVEGKEANITGKIVNDVEKRLIEFHKEIMEKYFQTLEKILHFGKEISVIDSLAHRVNDQDLENLKRTIMQPIIEARYKEEANKVDDRVKSFGNEILNRRKELHETMIKKERQEEDVTNLKEQIALLDWVIGAKNE